MTGLLAFIRRCQAVAVMGVAVGAAAPAMAFRLDTPPEWAVNLDTSLQYTAGWRAQDRDPLIANHLFFSQGDYKFADQGDMVTNRVQGLVEFQGIYKGQMGFRVSGSAWKDFAYDDKAHQNPGYGAINAYTGGRYSDYTKRYFLQGGEFLDAFVFANGKLGDTPVYAKVGRLSQYWGNAFFFGFSNIAYSQSPIDYIKGFSQPGSEVKELFLPRNQVSLTADLAPNLSVTGQYFLEYRPNRYPEAGTYLGFFDILFNGPQGTGALAGFGITENDHMVEPPDNNRNYGIKVSWAPEWAGGDLGFYYRQLDEVDPWPALVNPATGHLQSTFAEKTKLIGISYERSFGLVSTGFELNQRRHTALNSAGLAPSNQGARGNLTNFIANAFVQLGSTPLWDAGILLAEISYTQLNSVTSNEALYNGVGTANCRRNGTAAPGSYRDGCSTKRALAFATLFTPQWLQVWPGVDLELPISLTMGLKGNAAYRAGGFYAEDSRIYSVGLKAIYNSKTSLALQYNGYYWKPHGQADNGLGAGLPAYAGFGGNGPVSLNDRGWLQLTLKSSF
ncbi:MAG TPA: DUF1302 family protein [Methylibium sp.]|nr:DUF1302 family protein [Methylibium sp.]